MCPSLELYNHRDWHIKEAEKYSSPSERVFSRTVFRSSQTCNFLSQRILNYLLYTKFTMNKLHLKEKKKQNITYDIKNPCGNHYEKLCEKEIFFLLKM